MFLDPGIDEARAAGRAEMGRRWNGIAAALLVVVLCIVVALWFRSEGREAGWDAGMIEGYGYALREQRAVDECMRVEVDAWVGQGRQIPDLTSFCRNRVVSEIGPPPWQ